MYSPNGRGRETSIVSGAEAASVNALPSVVRELIDHASVLVVAPVVSSELHHWTNDTDRARGQADERLAGILSRIAAPGSEQQVAGVIGDDTLIMAFDDAAFARFRPTTS